MRARPPQAPLRRLIPRALAATIAAATLAAAGAACGDSDSDSEATISPEESSTPLPTVSQSRPMTAAEGAVIARARERVDAYCARVARALAGERPPTSAEFTRVTAALDELAALADRAPTAETIDGTTARLALGDIAENLEANNCDPRLVAHIDAALAGLPAG